MLALPPSTNIYSFLYDGYLVSMHKSFYDWFEQPLSKIDLRIIMIP